jgi:hypothetical protein
MAVPSYTNDLTDHILDTDTTAWLRFTGMAAGALPDEADTESALQGTNTVSHACNTTSAFSMGRVLTSPVTLSAGYVFLVWHGHGVATALATYANGGLRLVVGTDLDNWKAWAVGGYDTPPFPYGKWVNNPIDPTVSSDYSNGTPPTANYYAVGSAGVLTKAVAKGQPHVCDIIRYGRAEARFNGGQTSNYATFSGFAALNDASTARWGLIQTTDGGYLWKGLMTLGYSSAVDFRDSNKTIFIQDTRKVASTFNKIEIRQASSRVDWTGISFVCLSPSTTASKGSFEVIDDADVNFSGCTFVDLATFIFKAASDVLISTFRRCGQITAPGSNFSGTLIDSSTVAADTSALVWDVNTDPSGKLDNMKFIKGTNAHHAIELGTSSPTTVNLVGQIYSGFNASNAQNDSVIHVKRTVGTVTINYTGDAPSYKSAGATVVVQKLLTLTLTGLKTGSDIVILTAGTETELVNVDQNSGTTYAYGYTYTPSTYIDVGVFKAGYVPFYVRSYLLASTNASLPIAQVADRNYTP